MQENCTYGSEEGEGASPFLPLSPPPRACMRRVVGYGANNAPPPTLRSLAAFMA